MTTPIHCGSIRIDWKTTYFDEKNRVLKRFRTYTNGGRSAENFKGLWLKWLNGRKVVANFNPIWQAEGDFEFSSSACCSTLNQLWSSEKKWNNNILTITSWKIRDAWMILQNLSCSQGSSFILRELECWWKFEQLRMKIRFSLYSSAAQLWSLSAFFPSLCIALSLPISWVNMQNVNKAKKMSETGILNFSTISPP